MERKIHWKYYVASLFVTLTVFLAGMYFSVFLEKGKLEYLQESVQEIRLSQQDSELESRLAGLFDARRCDVVSKQIESIVPKAAELGSKLEFYEANERFQDPLYPLLKQEYTIALTRYWIFVRDFNENCEGGYDIVLYFYSNRECGDCSRQGSVLSYLKDQYPQKVMVFALDYNLDMGTVNVLKNVYNVTEAPSIVVNEKTHLGYQSLADMRSALNLTSGSS